MAFCASCGQPRDDSPNPCPSCGTPPRVQAAPAYPAGYGAVPPQPGAVAPGHGAVPPQPGTVPPGYAAPGYGPPGTPPGYGYPPAAGYATPAAARTLAIEPTDLVIAACGLAMFGFSFAPILTGVSEAVNGWDELFRQFIFVALLGAAIGVVFVLKTLTAVKIPERIVSFTIDQLAVVVGLVGVLCGAGLVVGTPDGVSMGWGAIVVLLVSIGMCVAAVVNLSKAKQL